MSTLMRILLLSLLAVLACFAIFDPPRTSAGTKPDQRNKPNFSGAWVVDLQASTSLDPLMTQIGAGFLDRKYAAHAKLKARLQQTDDLLTIVARGPGFAFIKPFISTDAMTPATCKSWEQLPSTPKRSGLRTTSSSPRLTILEPNREKTAN